MNGTPIAGNAAMLFSPATVPSVMRQLANWKSDRKHAAKVIHHIDNASSCTRWFRAHFLVSFVLVLL